MSREGKYFKKIKKDYQHKNFCNPFFHKPKKKVNKYLVFGLAALFFLFFIFLIWFFGAAPIWRINNIKIEGLTRIPDIEMQDKIWKQTEKSRWWLFRQSNIWLFDKAKMRQEILSSYNLASLEISKKLAKTLIIKVGERPYSFIFQQGNDLFYASSDGYIIRETAVIETDKIKYFILENKNSNDLISEKNKINIADDYLGFILNAANDLAAHPELATERFIIDQEYNTIKIKFRDGPLVYFNTKNDFKSQVERLLLVKREKIKDNFSKTNYIDLRYGDRIFIN